MKWSLGCGKIINGSYFIVHTFLPLILLCLEHLNIDSRLYVGNRR